MSRNKKLAKTAFLDLLLNALIGFIALFAVAFIQINPHAEDQSVKLDGKYLITAVWDPELEDDVDIYVMDPAQNIIYFDNREAGLMYLDHDDLGKKSDITKDAEGNSIVVKENVEHVTINGVMKGEYVVNVHMYAKVGPLPVKVAVRLTKLGKSSKEIIKEVTLSYKGDEDTAFRFTLDANGDVASINYLKKIIVRSAHDSNERR